MSSKLRQLIRAVRSCKTAAEERTVVSNECALIRTAFRDNNDASRARNVAKLLYIHMLGYPSHFGQMECIKLCSSARYADKRIGYLGLTLMLQDRDEVLMLVTNSLKVDLNAQSQYVVGLALAAVGNLATADMARDLAMEVDKHLRGKNTYLRKKAALCTMRVLKKCPELVDDFVERVVALLKDRAHGVLLAGVQLLHMIVLLDKDQSVQLARLVPSLVRLLRNLLSMGFDAEHDVAGISDPFLQVAILRLLRLLGEKSEEATDSMNDILAQVATNTETAKNAGNAILYECVQTIICTESEQGLRLLAVNILGRFLLNRDNNMRYVALHTLSKVIGYDAAAVQRHRSTIVDCLKDPDVSIRQRALQLIFQLMNPSNAEGLVVELLNYLVVAPPEHRKELCANLLQAAENHAPSKRWRIHTLVTMLSLTGEHYDTAIPAATIVYASQAPDLHAYTAHKTFRLMQSDLANTGLTLVGVWCAGEYGDLLLRPCAMPAEAPRKAPGGGAENGDLDSGGAPVAVPEENFSAVQGGAVVDLMERIMKDHFTTPLIRGYVLTALTKLTTRLGAAEVDRIQGLLSTYRGSIHLELQARSCEYSHLLKPDLSQLRGPMLDRMPILDEDTVRARRDRYKMETDIASMDGQSLSPVRTRRARSPAKAHEGGAAAAPPAVGPAPSSLRGQAPAPRSPPRANSLLDLDDLFAPQPQPARPPSGHDLLADIFSTNGSSQPVLAPNAPASPPVPNELADLFGPSPTAGARGSPPTGGLGFSSPQPAPLTQASPLQDLFASPPAVPTPTPAAPPPAPTVTALQKGGLTITFELSKPDPTNPGRSQLLAKFSNSTAREMTALHFQAAVPKYLKLELMPASGSALPAHATAAVEQVIGITNSLLGQKSVMMKLKVEYMAAGTKFTEEATVTSFPPGY